jgi:hypothetical protein
MMTWTSERSGRASTLVWPITHKPHRVSKKEARRTSCLFARHSSESLAIILTPKELALARLGPGAEIQGFEIQGFEIQGFEI